MTPILAAAIICITPGIIDGDTIQCADHRVRLWGIDAPERYTPEGPPATAYLARITKGRKVTCDPTGTYSYGRTVALCRVDGRDIAAEMVRSGHAVDWPKFSHGYYGKVR